MPHGFYPNVLSERDQWFLAEAEAARERAITEQRAAAGRS
jgi:hypothetical protein